MSMSRRIFLMTGCASVLLAGAGCRPPPTPRLMLLGAQDESFRAGPEGKRPILVVRTVGIPEYLDRRQLVYREGGSELKAFPDAVWAERLGVSATRALAAHLSTRLVDFDVQPFETASGLAPAGSLHISLGTFDAVSPTLLRLQGDWRLTGTRQAHGRLLAEEPLPSLTPDDIVAAMERALVQAAGRIATQIDPVPSADGGGR